RTRASTATSRRADRRHSSLRGSAHRGAFARAAQTRFDAARVHGGSRGGAFRFLALLLRRAEARIDSDGVIEESARVVEPAVIGQLEPATEREESGQRARWPLLDGVALRG